MQETWVWSLGMEDLPGEGNGNPLQYSYPENPMDRLWGFKEMDMTEWLTHTQTHKNFPSGTMDKNPPATAGDTGLIPGPGKFFMLWGNLRPWAATTETHAPQQEKLLN